MNHKMKFIVIGMLAVLFTTSAIAQEVKSLGLSEAIDLGIRNSKKLKISDARIAEAVALSQQALEKRLPDFNLTGSYLRLNSANVDLKTKTNNSTGNGPAPKVSQAIYGMANLSMPLYAGGRIRYGIESARLLEKATRLDAEYDRQNVIFNVISAYMNLYKASQSINVVKENLEASRQRDLNFSRLESNGLLARNDLLKAQLQTSNTELALLDAENDLQLANINMNLLLGIPENTILKTDSAATNLLPEIASYQEYEMQALQNRKDVLANATRSNAYSFNTKSAKAEAYPAIALTGGYIAANIPSVLTITNAVNVGIGIQYNLASLWKTNTKLAQAKAQQQQITAAGEILNDQVRLELSKDYQNYLLSIKRMDVYEKSFEQATENYRITNNKYINNLVTLTELLDADQALLRAKLNRQIAKAEAVLAQKKILLTTGTLTK